MPEALTGAHAGRALSREIDNVPGAEAVSGAEGNTNCANKGEAQRAWRGRRIDPEHAWKHHAREPGDPALAHGGWRRGPRWEV